MVVVRASSTTIPMARQLQAKQSRAASARRTKEDKTKSSANNLVANFFLQKKNRWRAHWHRFACLVTLDDEEDDNLRSVDRKCAN